MSRKPAAKKPLVRHYKQAITHLTELMGLELDKTKSGALSGYGMGFIDGYCQPTEAQWVITEKKSAQEILDGILNKVGSSQSTVHTALYFKYQEDLKNGIFQRWDSSEAVNLCERMRVLMMECVRYQSEGTPLETLTVEGFTVEAPPAATLITLTDKQVPQFKELPGFLKVLACLLGRWYGSGHEDLSRYIEQHEWDAVSKAIEGSGGQVSWLQDLTFELDEQTLNVCVAPHVESLDSIEDAILHGLDIFPHGWMYEVEERDRYPLCYVDSENYRRHTKTHKLVGDDAIDRQTRIDNHEPIQYIWDGKIPDGYIDIVTDDMYSTIDFEDEEDE